MTDQELAAERPAADLRCPQCDEPALAGELYCENCGAELPGAAAAVTASGVPTDGPAADVGSDDDPSDAVVAAAEPDPEAAELAAQCASCGASIAADGYCEVCGAPAVRQRDHWVEQPAAWVAGVCDRGIRHLRNEDGMALAAADHPGSRAVLVVCDGVSSSTWSDRASLAAARAARDLLDAGFAGSAGIESPDPDGDLEHWTESLTAAAQAANEATIEVADELARQDRLSANPPSCTFVAAVVDGPQLVVGWVGDSRAYWLPDAGPAMQLTIDDSWASGQIALGMSRQDAEAMPQAHAITRWLGVDSPDVQPRCTSVDLVGSGWALICSDGLWNYCSEPGDLSRLVARTAAEAAAGTPGGSTVGGSQAAGIESPDPTVDPVRLAAALVAWANEQGGHDNITVALARIGPTAGAVAGGSAAAAKDEPAADPGRSAADDEPDRGGPTSGTAS